MTKKRSLRGVFIIAGILTVAIILVITLGSDNKQPVVVAKTDIRCGTVINNGNVNDLFEVKELVDASLPKEYVSDIADMDNATVNVDMSANTIIEKGYYINHSAPSYNMKSPVIMGIKASDMAQFAGGVIRRGDRINISIVDSTTNECLNILENVYVTGAYNSDGTKIENDESCAMALNILVEKENEQKLNGMMALGELRVCLMGEN